MHKEPKAHKCALCSKRAATSRRGAESMNLRKCENVQMRGAQRVCSHKWVLRAHGTACAKMRKYAVRSCKWALHAQGAECAQMRAAPRARSRNWARPLHLLLCVRNAPKPRKCALRRAHAAAVRAQCAEAAQMRAAQRARSRSAFTSRRKRANARRATRAQLQAGASHGSSKGNNGGRTFDGLMGR
ncbi:hypothetical protein C8J57DRAFT_1233077 [Mycena rebaudengoi]|nr:hypothetical protein C8J57DRAFT_1233077 [Mycena rebaudengoi]